MINCHEQNQQNQKASNLPNKQTTQVLHHLIQKKSIANSNKLGSTLTPKILQNIPRMTKSKNKTKQ